MLWSLFWPRRCPIVVGWLDFLISHQFEEKKVMDGLVFFFFFSHNLLLVKQDTEVYGSQTHPHYGRAYVVCLLFCSKFQFFAC